MRNNDLSFREPIDQVKGTQMWNVPMWLIKVCHVSTYVAAASKTFEPEE